jgi:hypothetical protein
MPTLRDWWTRLEAAPGFGGPRRYVHDLLGVELARVLETGGVLRQVGIAPSYPCEERAGDHCPRTVIEIDGAHHAVCGNRPIGCRDLVLTEQEAGLLTTNMMSLCRIIASTLGTRGSPERIRDLSGAHRVGSIIPEPGIRYPVYLVIRSNAQSYAEAFGALVGRQASTPFSMLIPTGRFLTDQIEHQAQTRGVLILTLTDVLVLVDGRFYCAVDPETLFSSLGQRPPSSFGAADEIVARALVCDGISPHRWRDLDEPAYRALLADANSFDVFADEQTKIVHKGPIGARQTNTATASHFESIRLAVRKRGYFDPFEDDPCSRVSAQQIFQRARKLFDPRMGRGPWRLFKTIEGDERSLYHFSPDRGVSFAFVFLPER